MQTVIEPTITEPAPTLEQALIAAVREMPEDRAREVLDFALFLQARLAAIDAQWEASFEATPTSKLQAWLDAERANDTELTAIDDSGEVLISVPL